MVRGKGKPKKALWITGGAVVAAVAVVSTVFALLSENNAGRFDQSITDECAPLAVIAFRGSGEQNLTPGEFSNAGADHRYGETNMVTNGWEGATLQGLFDTLAHSEYEGLTGDQIPVVPIGPADTTEPFGYDAIMAVLEAASIDSALTFSGSKLLYSASRGAEAATHLINEYLVESEGCPVAPKFVIAGYSQGAMAARHTAELNPEHVLGVVTIGDPYQMPDGPGVRAEGASGNGIIRWKADDAQRAQLDAYYGSQDLRSSICHAGDPICEFTPVEGLLKLASGNYGDHMDYYSDRYPDEATDDANEVMRLAYQQWRLALAALEAGESVDWSDGKPGSAGLKALSLSLAGTPTLFSAMSPDHLGTQMVYEFDLDGDGIFETSSTDGLAWVTFDEEGTHTIGVRITNTETGERTDTQQTVTVYPSDSGEVHFDREGNLIDDPQAPESDGTPAGPEEADAPARDQEERPEPAPTERHAPRPDPSGPSTAQPPPTRAQEPQPAADPALAPRPAPRPKPTPSPEPEPTPTAEPNPTPDPELPPTFALDTRHAFPGSTIQLTGTSVTPGAQVSVTATDPALGLEERMTSGADGSVALSLTIPRQSFMPDEYTVRVDVDGEMAETLTFLLWDPSVQLEGNPAQPGESIVASGQGFAPHSSVHVYGSFGFSSSLQTDAHGSFTDWRIPVHPNTVPGMYSLSFQLGLPGPTLAQVVQILPGLHPEPVDPPAFSLDSSHAFPGSQLLVNGTSVARGAEVAVSADSLNLHGSGTPGDDGTVGIALNVPTEDVVPGKYDLNVSIDGEHVDVLPFELWDPTVQVEGAPLEAGYSVVISGQGFSPDTTVYLTTQWGYTDAWPTDDQGIFSEHQVPVESNVAPGTYSLNFQLGQGGPIHVQTIEVLATPEPEPVEPPSFHLNTPYAFPGSALHLSGTSVPLGSDVVVTSEGLATTERATPATDGSLSLSLTAAWENITVGEYTLDVQVDGELADTFTFSLWDPSVQLEGTPIYPGGTVVSSGFGFAPNTTVYVTDGWGTALTWLTDDSGAFTDQQIEFGGSRPPGTHTLSFQLGQGGPAHLKTFEVLPTPPAFSLTPSDTMAGDLIYLNGAMLPPHAQVTVNTDNSALAIEGSGVADRDGRVQIPLRIPDEEIIPGEYGLLVEVNGELLETLPLWVWDPVIHIEGTPVQPGQTAVVSGYGLKPNAVIEVSGSWGFSATWQTNSEGSFAEQPVPVSEDVREGSYNLAFEVEGNGLRFAQTFEIELEQPTFTLDTPHVFPGSELHVTGASVPPGARVLAVSEDNRLLAQGEAFAENDGTVTISVLMPNQGIVPDDYDLDIEINGELAQTLTFSAWTPAVQLERTQYRAGDTIVASGEGFAPEASVHVHAVPLGFSGLGPMDDAGRFPRVEIPIPDDQAPGVYDLNFRLLPQGPTFTTQIEVLPEPQYSIDIVDVFPGTQFRFTGHYFPPGSEVYVTTDHSGLPLGWRVLVSNDGTVSIDFEVPRQDITPGEYELYVVIDEEEVEPLTFTAWVPTVEFETAPFYAGDTIEVTGSGFAPNSEVDVATSFGYGQTWLTDAAGALGDESIPIPAGVDPQEYDVTFQLGQVGPVITESIEVLADPAPVGPPEFSINAQHAFPGNELFVTGTSVPPGSNVVVTTDDSALPLEERGFASDTGRVQLRVPIPNQGITAGTYDLKVSIDGELADTFTVSLWTPSVQVGAVLAHSWNALIASGQGFAPDTTVYVYDEWGAETELVTDGAGAFVEMEISMNTVVAPGTYTLEFHMGRFGPVLRPSVNVMPNYLIAVNSVLLAPQARFEISQDQNVTIEGSGFFANQELRLDSYAPGDGDTPGGQQTIRTDASGRFRLGFSFSGSSAGEYIYYFVYNDVAGNTVTQSFTVVVVE